MVPGLTVKERQRCRGGVEVLKGCTAQLDEDRVLDRWRESLSQRGRPGFPESVAVYVNVPYCRSRCRYCMYTSNVCQGPHLRRGFVAYVQERLRRLRARSGRIRASSLYIGGGTPSVLDADEIQHLFDALGETFDVRGDITFEAHPASLDVEKISLAVRHGVNRISFGVQSTQRRVLAAVGRQNPPRSTLEGLARAVIRQGVFLNVDLMVGLPEQTASGVADDLRWALRLGARSVTLYRYQPVQQLPATNGRVSYADLSWPALVTRAVGAGYVPVWDGDPDAYSVTFFRPLPHGLPAVAALPSRLVGLVHLVRSGILGRPLPADARLVHFTGFDVSAAHTLGIGPGAISHLYGSAWYRDDTDAASLDAATHPRFTGIWLRRQDELRAAVIRDLAEGRWVRGAEQVASAGLDPDALLDGLPDGPAAALQRRRDRFRLRTTHPAAGDVLRWLLASSSAGSFDPGRRGDPNTSHNLNALL